MNGQHGHKQVSEGTMTPALDNSNSWITGCGINEYSNVLTYCEYL